MRLSLIAVAALAASALAGGCSRCGRSADTATGPEAAAVVRDDPADILSHPAPFDAQSVADCVDLVAADRILTSAEAARVIVTSEAAVNHLGEILEELDRNDDPADTYNVLLELDNTPWPGQLDLLIAGLDRQPLDAPERERADALKAARERTIILYRQLHKN